MTLTNKLPDKPGFYWWTDGCERVRVVEVTEENDGLYAQTEDLCFNVNLCDEDDYWGYIFLTYTKKQKI